MKKLLLIVSLLLLMTSVKAQKEPRFLRATIFDSVTAADTGDIRYDTAFSPWQIMDVGRWLHWGLEAIPGARDTVWVGDSVAFALQLSFDGSPLVVTKTVTLTSAVGDTLSTGGTLGEWVYDADSTNLPPYGRLRVIFWDSIGVTVGDSALVNTPYAFETKYKFWFNWR